MSTSTATLTVALYLGAETPLTQAEDMLLTISNSSEVNQRLSLQTPVVNVTLPYHDGPGDAYRLVANVDGYHDCGGFVHADPHTHQTVSLLLIPKNAKLHFPTWEELRTKFPVTARLIAAKVDDAAAAARYAALAAERPLALASLMNLSAAMQKLVIGEQKTPLDFIQEVIWDDTVAQDRFFAYADRALLPLVRAAAEEDEFEEEFNPGALHPGATCSYKQSQFDYSNVQLTFHEHDTKRIGDVDCIKIEPDMDLFKEPVAHGLGELIPNLSTHRHTNPLDVLALRWIDAVQSGEPLFDPGYQFA